jgi:hypothetical protein
MMGKADGSKRFWTPDGGNSGARPGGGSTFMLAIHADFSSPILSGRKTVEFRRRIPKGLKPGDRVLLYETAPVTKVIGGFTVAEVIRISEWNGARATDVEGSPSLAERRAALVYERKSLSEIAAEGCLDEKSLIGYASSPKAGGGT